MSSSSEEDLSKFREATDVDLFNDSLFVVGKAENKSTDRAKPSLRYLDTPDVNRTDLKVTQGFQKHVASHLMRILDSSLDKDIVPTSTATPDHDSNGNCMSEVPPNKPEGGVKLFGASAAFLANCDIIPPPLTKRRKRGRKLACISSESEDESTSDEVDINKMSLNGDKVKALSIGPRAETELSEQFAACAVSSDWIINGDAVKGWAPPLKNQEPIQGEATPDLLNLFVRYKREKSKKKSKKKKVKEESGKQSKRGKRGRKHSKKKVSDNDISGKGQEPTDNGDSLTKAPKKKRRKESFPECEGEENEYGCIEDRHTERCQEIRAILEELGVKKEIEGTSSELVSVECFGKGKKRTRKMKLELANVVNRTEVREALDGLFKKVKKEMKERRKRRDDGSPKAEDEGFDSDPTKAERKRQRKLLKARLKKERKREKKWQNKIEFLSENLANLVMSNVKQD